MFTFSPNKKKIIGSLSDAKSFHLKKISCLPSSVSPFVTPSPVPALASHSPPICDVWCLSRRHLDVPPEESIFNELCFDICTV